MTNTIYAQLPAEIMINSEAEMATFGPEQHREADAIIEGMIDPCVSAIGLETTVINYESSSLVFASTDKWDGTLSVEDASGTATPLVLKNGYGHVWLPNGAEFQIVGLDACNQPAVFNEISTRRRATGEAVRLSSRQHDVILDWQRGDKTVPLWNHVRDDKQLTVPEKTFLIQQLLYTGTPLPDTYRERLNLTNPTTGQIPEQPDSKSVVSCRCTVLAVKHALDVQPIETIRDNGQRRDIYGKYGSEPRYFRSGDIYTWRGWGLEGPGRYQQLQANTTDCVKAPYSFSWNGAFDNRTEQEGEEDVITAADYFASMVYNMVCLNNDGNADDCGCPRTVSFEAQYHSLAQAQAFTLGGQWFCNNTYESRAKALDAAFLSVGRINDEDSYQTVAQSLNGQIRGCGRSYTGPTLGEMILLGYNIYKLVKSTSTDSGEPIIDAAADAAWDIRHADAFKESIEDVFDGPWVTWNGQCGGELVGRSSNFSLVDDTGEEDVISPTLGNAGIVNFQYELNPGQPFRVVLAAGSSMAVGGLRKWYAKTRILSSFRLASVLSGGTGETDDEGLVCCTPRAGSYMLSAVTGDVPGSGVTEDAWRQLCKSFLFINGIDIDIRPDDEIGYKVNESRCPTPVDVIYPGKSLIGGDSTPEPTAITPSLTDISVYDLSGRRVWMSRQTLSALQVTEAVQTLGQLPAGVYVVVKQYEGGRREVTKTVKQ